MIGKEIKAFFARRRTQSFERNINREIFSNLFPHLEHESDEGYSFDTDTEMIAQTEELDPQRLLKKIQSQIEKLPTAYGQCFRYLMHKDIHERLQMYARLAKRETQPATIACRSVAKRA